RWLMDTTLAVFMPRKITAIDIGMSSTLHCKDESRPSRKGCHLASDKSLRYSHCGSNLIRGSVDDTRCDARTSHFRLHPDRRGALDRYRFICDRPPRRDGT